MEGLRTGEVSRAVHRLKRRASNHTIKRGIGRSEKCRRKKKGRANWSEEEKVNTECRSTRIQCEIKIGARQSKGGQGNEKGREAESVKERKKWGGEKIKKSRHATSLSGKSRKATPRRNFEESLAVCEGNSWGK